ncbi:diacylglycerol/lipid kinase family protein [[Clostridium] fimetarium]|uniref:Lipid kinase, YegS/Rv2252/BmrU family n=1 Tax=[Clostridium] fimetarium TaxID=99656 RepID=A0A1I0QA52_9FIRM|nr:diacylglycerol kinase family protein [[Clostridium] fimetarium]SEW23912.1 lipid kinase, YegS/Rv2252/BmrU family [[Clostridium] fimetarium]
MKKMLFVINPNSGKAQIKNVLLSIIQTFSSAGYEVTVYPTKSTLDGFNHVKEAEGIYDLIVCSGGDGTFNETIAAVMGFSSEKPPIGYIPSGTTNDFAVSLSIPKDMKKAAEHIVVGIPRKCDVGVFNGRSFNYIAAFGAFTDVAYQTSQSMKNMLGHQAYILEAVKRLAFLKSYKMKVTYEDGIITDEFMYGMISNTKSVGGMKGLVGKSVKLNDGLFEVTLIKQPKNALEFQQLLSGFITQSIIDKDMVYSFKTSTLLIESEVAITWTLDGEFGGENDRVEFNVAKDGIELILKKHD